MPKLLIVLAVAGVTSGPAIAQTAPVSPAASATSQAQPAQPAMVKKRICEDTNDDPTTRIHNRVCKTVLVPAQPAAAANARTPSAGQSSPGN